MAHKLARILWHLLKFQEPFDPGGIAPGGMKRQTLARRHNLVSFLAKGLRG